MSKATQVRQGDVLLHPVKAVPDKAKAIKPELDGFVLALGEHTGHGHIVPKGGGTAVLEAEGKKYLVVEKETSLQHIHRPTGQLTTDHDAIEKVAPGTYEVRIQQETQPDGMVRPVLD